MGRYIPPAWLQHTEVGDWASEVEKLWPDLISKDLQELEILFVEQCRDRYVCVINSITVCRFGMSQYLNDT